jgi:cell division protein FtsW
MGGDLFPFHSFPPCCVQFYRNACVQVPGRQYSILYPEAFPDMIVGLVIIFVTHMVPYKFYSRLSQLFLISSIILLALTLIIGTSINEASRWLTLPGLGFTIQTSDFAKLSLIMYLARVLSRNQNIKSTKKESFLSLLIPVLLVCALILPANLSTALILFATCLILMFIGRVNNRYMGGLVMAGIFLFHYLLQLHSTARPRAGWEPGATG